MGEEARVLEGCGRVFNEVSGVICVSGNQAVGGMGG